MLLLLGVAGLFQANTSSASWWPSSYWRKQTPVRTQEQTPIYPRLSDDWWKQQEILAKIDANEQKRLMCPKQQAENYETGKESAWYADDIAKKVLENLNKRQPIPEAYYLTALENPGYRKQLYKAAATPRVKEGRERLNDINLPMMKALLEQDKKIVDIPLESGKTKAPLATALEEAILMTDPPAVRLLLEYGANPLAIVGDGDYKTPLKTAQTIAKEDRKRMADLHRSFYQTANAIKRAGITADLYHQKHLAQANQDIINILKGANR